MVKSSKAEGSSLQRILSVATDLFAEHGYEGVSTRQLAEAVGLNLATIHHHAGSKRELYVQVFEKLFAQEEELVNGIVESIDDSVIEDAQLLHEALARLISRLLLFAQTHPSRQRLYVQRWLEPADELRAREAKLTLYLYRRLEGVLKRGQELGTVRHDVDIGYFMRTFDYMVFGYFTCGAFSWRTLRADPLKKENLSAFRAHLLDYTKRMLEA